MSADNSYEARIKRLRERTLAVFHARNPTAPEAGRYILDESTRTSRRVGQMRVVIQPPEGPAYEVAPCCPSEECLSVCPVSTIPFDVDEPNTNTPVFFPGDLSGDETGIPVEFLNNLLTAIYGTPTSITPPDGYPYEAFIFVIFPTICNATSYSINLYIDGSPIPFESTQYGASTFVDIIGDQGIGGVFVMFPNIDIASVDYLSEIIVTGTASNACSSSSGDAQFFCFLAGSPVTLADGTTKPIETVAVGDRVVGAFGEINTVTGTLSNNLGPVPITNINGEHKTTAPHPHITADHKLCCTDLISLKMAYGRRFPLKGADGTTEHRVIKGVASERITKLEVGTILQTQTGPRAVTSLEKIRMPPSTRVYHLTTDGSHSYLVDGYAVAGGATEDDFDYDSWTPRTD